MARTKKKGRGGKKSKVNFSSLPISFVVKFGHIVWRDSELVLGAFSHAETVVRMLYNIFCVPVTYFLSLVILWLFFSCLGFMV
jgi:hypothetical protein